MPSSFSDTRLRASWALWHQRLARALRGPLTPGRVHRARVALKHLRVLAPRQPLLRALSRALSPIRDFDVVIGLAPRFEREPRYRQWLRRLRQRRSREVAWFERCFARSLGLPPRRLPASPARPADRALRRLQKKSRRLRKLCQKGGTPSDFHEWRKALKRELFMGEALGLRPGSKGRPRENDPARIAGLLGRAHDLERLACAWVAIEGRPSRELQRIRAEARRLMDQSASR